MFDDDDGAFLMKLMTLRSSLWLDDNDNDLVVFPSLLTHIIFFSA